MKTKSVGWNLFMSACNRKQIISLHTELLLQSAMQYCKLEQQTCNKSQLCEDYNEQFFKRNCQKGNTQKLSFLRPSLLVAFRGMHCTTKWWFYLYFTRYSLVIALYCKFSFYGHSEHFGSLLHSMNVSDEATSACSSPMSIATTATDMIM